MTVIKRSSDLIGDCPLALILGKGTLKKGQFGSLISKETAERFFASDKKFDYLKLEDNFIFLIKEDQKAEELRVIGSKIQGFVADSFEQISLVGKEKSVLYLAEGLALANYQFNRFFSKPKNNKLHSILVHEEFEEAKIEENSDVTDDISDEEVDDTNWLNAHNGGPYYTNPNFPWHKKHLWQNDQRAVSYWLTNKK